MRREDVADIFLRLPDFEHPRVHIIMMAGPNISIDTVVRLEENYAVIRGREAGNQDEGRVFFLPFDSMICMKMERVVRAAELDEWYRNTEPMAKKGGEENGAPRPAEPLPEPEQLDPAEIARRNLLERIRAARSVVSRRG